MRTEQEKQSLIKLFQSKQAEKNENLINEQRNLIDNLKQKCQAYELELKNTLDNKFESNMKELKDEISILRNLIYRLNVELSYHQAKNPSQNLQTSIKVIELNLFIYLIKKDNLKF